MNSRVVNSVVCGFSMAARSTQADAPAIPQPWIRDRASVRSAFSFSRESLYDYVGAMKLILSIIVLVFAIACSSPDSSSGSAAQLPPKQIDIFKEGSQPERKFTVIKTLVDDGGEIEEDEITAKFIQTARKTGGDAIIVKAKKQSGAQIVPFGFGKVNLTYVYRADVIKYE
jgi:hypothetical protein